MDNCSMIFNNAINIFPNNLKNINDNEEIKKNYYNVHKFINQGTCGMIFLVEKDGEFFAVKIINLTKKKICVKNEIECMKLCNHNMVVKFYDSYFTPDNTHSMIIMEYADMDDLKTVICGKRSHNIRLKIHSYFDESKILYTFCQIIKGISHIHNKNIIHRDIKPENIYMTSNNQIKIGDFHLSKIYEDDVYNVSDNERVGTPYYVAPEIWKNESYNAKLDVWALGVVLYELVALRCPFFSHELDELENLILKGKYDQIPDCYSIELQNLIDSMLCQDPKGRPTITKIIELPFLQNYM